MCVGCPVTPPIMLDGGLVVVELEEDDEREDEAVVELGKVDEELIEE